MQVGAVWRRTLNIHLLPIVICELTLVVAAWHVKSVGIVFQISLLGLEKLRLLEQACHWRLLLTATNSDSSDISRYGSATSVYALSLAYTIVKLLQEMLVDFLVRGGHFLRCSWNNRTYLAKIGDAHNVKILVAILLAKLAVCTEEN